MSLLKHLLRLTLVTAAPILTGCGSNAGGLPPVKDAKTTTGTIANLFEWRYEDVGRECRVFLGPAGYSAVQVSSPAENSVVEGRPWWERYQPVSYILESPSGNRDDFSAMVRECNSTGVDVYVDVILNHMTGVYSGRGTAGSLFGEYEYPGIYDRDDFHHCGLTPGDDIEDYNDPEQVWNCELVNLADLKTESEKVRRTLSSYLKDLLDLGVTGFRVDAARHIRPADLSVILREAGGTPFVYQEVVDLDRDMAWMLRYTGSGIVTDFRYGGVVGRAFSQGRIDRLVDGKTSWSRLRMLPSDSALVFLDNHDTQRHAQDFGALTYRDGAIYELANVFMLAWPYGRPRVMSSYDFTERDSGPPSVSEGITRPVFVGGETTCSGGEWVCEHRRPQIAGMVAFRNATSRSPSVKNVWTNGSDQIAFARGNTGFVVINSSEQSIDRVFQTNLTAGDYCDRLDKRQLQDSSGTCRGQKIGVQEDGSARIRIDALTAAAFYRELVP